MHINEDLDYARMVVKISYLAMTSYEGPAPGLEVWPAPPRFCDPLVAAGSIARTLDRCAHADQLGFDWVSVSEHHYAPYMMTPNPMIMASAIAQRVTRATIALLGPLVPLNNPVRLAEEIAMLDAMTGGRTAVLFLRGTPNEHHTYDTQGDTRAMTQEGIDLILKAWREEEPFAWKGEHYNFSTVSVWPRVVQKPHPVVFGSGNSTESIDFAAERGLGIAFSFAPVEVIRDWIALYRERTAKHGWTPTPEHIIYRGIGHVAPSDEQAVEEATRFFGEQAAQQARIQARTMGGPPVNSLILQPYFLGGPETLIARFDVLRACGVGVVDMVFLGHHAQQMSAMSLFASHVMPAIQSWDHTHFDEEAAALVNAA
jgi:alkanesulfonate monooxygenase SsuD/methylene tetrahydromethanopterin reductase-like flavin-dependent oxidoreductase (luciferase family)